MPWPYFHCFYFLNRTRELENYLRQYFFFISCHGFISIASIFYIEQESWRIINVNNFFTSGHGLVPIVFIIYMKRKSWNIININNIFLLLVSIAFIIYIERESWTIINIFSRITRAPISRILLSIKHQNLSGRY